MLTSKALRANVCTRHYRAESCHDDGIRSHNSQQQVLHEAEVADILPATGAVGYLPPTNRNNSGNAKTCLIYLRETFRRKCLALSELCSGTASLGASLRLQHNAIRSGLLFVWQGKGHFATFKTLLACPFLNARTERLHRRVHVVWRQTTVHGNSIFEIS